MKRSDLLNDVMNGQVSLSSRSDLSIWPEFEALKTCPQDPLWHAEGNVFIHTDMVLEESKSVEKLISAKDIGILRLACLLHDIDKPNSTKYDEAIKHTIAPGHERMGGITSRYLLREMHISNDDRRLVSQLVATHHLVKRAVQNIDAEGGKAFLERLAERVDTKLLYALELADMRGRTSVDKNNQVEIVELFKMICEEMDIFGKAPTPWITEDDIKEIPFRTSSAIEYALAETHRRRLTGQMSDEYEAKAFCWNYAKINKLTPRAYITVGASGSGKSSFLTRYNPEDIVSTDAIRKQLYGDESIIGDGEVFQIANEKLRESLRAGKFVIYDATNTIPDFRKKVVDLCHDYGAYVKLIVFDISKEEMKLRNSKRERQVPDEVIDKQCAKFEWPMPEEAHEIQVVNEID